MPEEKNSTVLRAITEYGKNLLGFIRRRVKSDEDAEDVLQDVWYQFSSLVNTVPVEQTGAWLYRVARNRIIDRHKKKSESLLDDLFSYDPEDETLDFKDILMSDDRDPEAEYFRTVFWDRLFAALDELPGDQKQVFIWHEIENMSFQEMSDVTGMKVATLVSRKRYAVLHLRQRLRQLYLDITNS